jgi:hypothetical protein
MLALLAAASLRCAQATLPDDPALRESGPFQVMPMWAAVFALDSPSAVGSAHLAARRARTLQPDAARFARG